MDETVTDPEPKRLKLDEDFAKASATSVLTDNDSPVATDPKSSNSEGAGVALLVEKDVGITEFISKHEGFSGIIKQRFSDFLVNEISLDGEVTHLTDTTLPATISDTSVEKEEAEHVDSIITCEDREKLRRLSACRDTSAEVLIKVGTDKQLRGDLHKAIRASFPDLESQTIERDNEKFVFVKFVLQKDNRRPDGWKKSEGDYTKFILYKENMDTLEAINIISKCLRVKTNCFTYAGTKDRRAKTCQEVTGYRIMPQRLSELNRRKMTNRKMVLGNFRQCKEPLKLGDLKGNRFVIVLRNVTGSEEQIEQAMTSLIENGFINYYGMQRFGTTQVPTHWVGRALLNCNWSEAIDLILQPRDGDKPEVAKARKIWQESRDAAAALKELEFTFCTERQLLNGLQCYKKNDLVSALGMISRNMRLMYIHAYQSYVWNQVASRRLSQLGYRVCVGDLVLPRDASLPEDCGDDNDLTETIAKQKSVVEVVIVTADNISQFTMLDVVLPLPGYDVKYPQNVCAEFYGELMNNDNMKDFNFKHHIRDYALPGSYRRVVIRPEDVTWEVVPYDDYQIPLAPSDHDRLQDRGQLQHVPLEQQHVESEQRDCEQQKDEQQGQNESKAQNLNAAGGDNLNSESKCTTSKYRALKIEINLPSSCYATMALREILKCGTSSAYQATLNAT